MRHAAFSDQIFANSLNTWVYSEIIQSRGVVIVVVEKRATLYAIPAAWVGGRQNEGVAPNEGVEG